MDQACKDLRINLHSTETATNAARTFLLMEGLEWEEYFKHHDNIKGTNSLGLETKNLCCKMARFQESKSQFNSSEIDLKDTVEIPPELLVRWPDETQLPDVLRDNQENNPRHYDATRSSSHPVRANGNSKSSYPPEEKGDDPSSQPVSGFKSARVILDPNAKIGSGSTTKKNTSTESSTSERHSRHSHILQDERMRSIDAKLAERILDELMEDCANVTWESIAGLADVKSRIKEMVVMPMLRPDLFKGIRAPGKGLLLFGPPGTGKTMIGKCIASQSKATFFNISSAALTSKWVGEGEKMVKAMFAIARVMAPTVIFIDEIDSLLLQRNDSDHESSRRMKTEFLLQFDGCGTDDEEKLLIVGATNRPEGLDEAARRRFTKRLYVPLPDIEARIGITRNLVAQVPTSLTQEDYLQIGKITEGYSGSDMKRVCNEASMIALREALHIYGDITQVKEDSIRPLTVADFENALKKTKTSVAQSEIVRYEQFNSEFGALDI